MSLLLRTSSSSNRTTCGGRLLQATNMPLHRQYILQLSIGVLISISNGAIFCFGIFSPYLKQAPFEFTQSQVNTIATAGAMASFITPPVGYLYDHYGARITLAAGAGINLLGWMGLYFIFLSASTINPQQPNDGILGSNTTTLMIILIVFSFSQMSSPFYEQGSVLANLQGLSSHRGKVVLIQKTFMGLGSGLISQIYSTFFVHTNTSTVSSSRSATSFPALESLGYFCLLLAVYSVITGLLGALVTNVPKGRSAASLRVPGINNAPPTIQSSASPQKIMALPPITSPPSSPTKIQPVVEDDNTPSTPTTMTMTPARFTQLSDEEVHLAKQFDSYFRPATVLTLILVALVAIITIVDTYWSTSLKEEGGSSAGFDAWQLWTSITSMGLCALFVPMVYLVPLRAATTSSTTMLTTAPVVVSPPNNNSNTSNAGTHQQREHDVWGRGRNVSDSETQEDDASKKKSSITTSVDMSENHQPGSHEHEADDCGGGVAPTTITTTALGKFELNTSSLKTNLLASPNWWFLWLQCFCVWGVATLVSTNSSQIYYALDPSGYSDTSNAAMVSIFGVASALGRVVVGALVGMVQGWKASPSSVVKRPLLLSTSTSAATSNNNDEDHEQDNLIPSTKSLLSCKGRLSHQYDLLVRRLRSHQPDELIPIYFLLVPSFILSVGLPLFLVSPPGMLLVCFFLVGFAAGFTYGSVILVVSGLLAQEHAGKHYGFVGSAGFATPILFNIVIFAQTYDHVGASQSGFAANNNQCVGRECLYSSLLVSTALSTLAFVLMVVLVRRVIKNGKI